MDNGMGHLGQVGRVSQVSHLSQRFTVADMIYRYTLDNSSKKFLCPQCGKKRLVKYIDQESQKYLADHIGRCDREVNCGYHFIPKEYFNQNPHLKDQYQPLYSPKNPVSPPVHSPTSYIPRHLFRRSLRKYEHNHFLIFLGNLLGKDKAHAIAQKFYIGTSKLWKGATIFWQLDCQNRVRTGKIMLYNAETGKRVKKPYNHINWVHSYLRKKDVIQDFHLDQCLFGLHQLQNSEAEQPVGIVESEKTAILLSACVPEIMWMATGGLSNLRLRTLQPLKGREIIFYPDLNAYDRWAKKADIFQKEDFSIKVSKLLETYATSSDREAGWDLADFIVKEIIVQREMEELEKNNPESLTFRKQILEQMIENNPVVGKLVQAFNLKIIF